MPYVDLRAAYVDNPFFDPLEPAALSTAEDTTNGSHTDGHNAQFDVAGGLRTTWHTAGRLELDLYGCFSTWQGDADTTGWDAAIRLAWAHAIGDAVEVRIVGLGATAAIDAFPEDELRWGEARVGARWALGRHVLDARIGYGRRTLPERVAGDGSTGQDDDLIRGALSARLAVGGGFTIEPTYTADLTRGTNVDHDTHALSVGVARPLGGVQAELHTSGWLRDFALPDGSAMDRLDIGFAVEGSVTRTLFRGLEVSARYRYLRSTSDDAFGDYAQHFAGLGIVAWYAPPPARSAPGSATPVPVPDGWLFRHRAPDAGTVSVVGDFNDWSIAAHPMTGPDAHGWWQVTVPLPPGRHGYMFVVDGEQFVRPIDAPRYADDGFGGEVGVVFVVPDDGPERAAQRPYVTAETE